MSETAEKVYFQKGIVLVTNARFVNGSNTYAMRNVSAVKHTTKPPDLKWAAVLLLLAVASLFGGYWVLALLLGAPGAFIIYYAKATHIVVLTSNGGDISALEMDDKQLIDEVVTALNQSIIERG